MGHLISSEQTKTATEEDFLVFGSPLIQDAEIQEVDDTLRSGWIGTGPKVARFEEEFRRYKGDTYAIAVSSCTAALHLSVVAAQLKPGDEVITTPLTFCATVNAIIQAGATPVLADVDPVTSNIDPAAVEKRLTPRTRAILPVHFAGRPCDMSALGSIAESHRLTVIEDCAHAIEASYRGRPTGTLGEFGCFSFYATKNVITGEGGMILTHDEAQAERLKILALHGMSHGAWNRFNQASFKHYYVVAYGFKYNMTDIQAAIGIHQLQRVEENWVRRQAIWNAYNDAFADLPIRLPAPPEPNTRHGYHLYTILVDGGRSGLERDEFLQGMIAKGIGVGVHYLSIPEHPYYQETFGWKPEEFPHAMQIGRQTVSLPLSPRLTDSDVERVISAVTSLLT